MLRYQLSNARVKYHLDNKTLEILASTGYRNFQLNGVRNKRFVIGLVPVEQGLQVGRPPRIDLEYRYSGVQSRPDPERETFLSHLICIVINYAADLRLRLVGRLETLGTMLSLAFCWIIQPANPLYSFNSR